MDSAVLFVCLFVVVVVVVFKINLVLEFDTAHQW
jgi:hypothetical protein